MKRLSIVLVLTLLSNTAYAHVGFHEAAGFSSGLLHPLTGIDHILAMFSVGLLATSVGGRTIWLAPCAFLAAMAAGAALGNFGFSLPFAEVAIALSVVAFGLAYTFNAQLPTAAIAVMVAVFAVFHGYAHGVEMPTNESGLDFGAGFLLATALLHATGIAMGYGMARVTASAARLLGGVVAASGAFILVGLV